MLWTANNVKGRGRDEKEAQGRTQVFDFAYTGHKANGGMGVEPPWEFSGLSE